MTLQLSWSVSLSVHLFICILYHCKKTFLQQLYAPVKLMWNVEAIDHFRFDAWASYQYLNNKMEAESEAVEAA